jgi:DNA gyrase subunit B
MYPPKPLKLEDCRSHGPDSELIIVEGDSAAGAVCLVRDEQTQAVLPLQGKPLNAAKASEEKVAAFGLYKTLIDTCGADSGARFDLQKLRYGRIVLLMDPDADGIHCGVLMLLFFHRFMRPLLEAGRLVVVQAPLASISGPTFAEPVHPHTDAELRSAFAQLAAKNITDAQTVRYRGLAGIDQPTLAHTCVQPATRRARVLTVADAQEALVIFGGTS